MSWKASITLNSISLPNISISDRTGKFSVKQADPNQTVKATDQFSSLEDCQRRKSSNKDTSDKGSQSLQAKVNETLNISKAKLSGEDEDLLA